MNAIEQVIEQWRKSVASDKAPIGVPQNDHEVVQMVRTADADELEHLNREVIEPASNALRACLRMTDGDGHPPDWDAVRAALAKLEGEDATNG